MTYNIISTGSKGNAVIINNEILIDCGVPFKDIKPYIKYADSRPDAVCGYVDALEEKCLEVEITEEMVSVLNDQALLDALKETLSLDPRPSYHNDPSREYGLSFAGYNIRFKVNDGVLTVISIS